ncbi:MAG: lipoate-protein ligase [Planctomycetota bacterium]
MSGPDGATLRVVRTGALPPAMNLAVDEHLLEHGVGTTIRIYGWEPPGLSIGRFQDAAQFADVPGPHVIVRRPTGGGAIYHGDELTFAAVFDARRDWDTDQTYVRLHDAVRLALQDVGVDAERVGAEAPSPSPRAHKNAWCFAVPGRHDLVAPDGRKILGSAQRRVRRPRDRVLVHGSLVLARPAATPFVAAVADQVELQDVRATLEAAVLAALAEALEPSNRRVELPLTEGERAAAATRANRFAVRDGGVAP